MFVAKKGQGLCGWVFLLGLALCSCGMIVLMAGCGQGVSGDAGTATTLPTSLESGVAGSSSSTSVVPGASSGDQPALSSTSTSSQLPVQSTDMGGAANVFAKLATEMSVAVYAPDYLPDGASLSEHWWPVLELADPREYSGSPVENPRIDHNDDGSAISAQVLYEVGEGWLLVLENFRGDLGDTQGKEVGSVQGHKAVLYELGDAVVVQWSTGGEWYAVFGRGVDSAEVIKVALSMEVIGPSVSAH